MDRQKQKILNEHFEKGKALLMAQESLLYEMAATFEAELWDCLEQRSLFRLGRKIALETQPPLQEILVRQIIFTWGLGFAVGSTSISGKSRS
ncbi:MAG: hypothetical protein GX044_11690 [Firmicutes bacterium]|nr:hypothetical protein [Bacillota bacterium]